MNASKTEIKSFITGEEYAEAYIDYVDARREYVNAVTADERKAAADNVAKCESVIRDMHEDD